ncbi:hypothetical protein HC752_20465 [Vibrio sp. S9_S30]|uniref:hypothetical protein n=1 Tax=Vibrio sp. S9_S30 TaxID=2720226 RepID=UPI00188B7830|nr:hypothetical protein [Vibrio sp. S9_S30]MBD1559319.1 hypothetical protein [Vibrio sp. S9_S30]
MTSIGTEPVRVTPTATTTGNAKSKAVEDTAIDSAVKVEQNKVTLSNEGKALLAALQQIEKDAATNSKEKSVGEKVESFAHGALGMAPPDKFKEEEDTSYSAGQYLSAAATIGGILALLV